MELEFHLKITVNLGGSFCTKKTHMQYLKTAVTCLIVKGINNLNLQLCMPRQWYREQFHNALNKPTVGGKMYVKYASMSKLFVINLE